MFDAGPLDEPRSAWDLVGEVGKGTFRGGIGADELACHRVFVAYARTSERFARFGAQQIERATRAREKEEGTMARVDMKERGEVLVAALRKFIKKEGRNPSLGELAAFAGLSGPTDAALSQAAKKALEPIRGTIVDWSKPGGVWPLADGKPNAAGEKPAKERAARAKSPPARGAREVPAASLTSLLDVVQVLEAKRDALLAEAARIDRAIAELKAA